MTEVMKMTFYTAGGAGLDAGTNRMGWGRQDGSQFLYTLYVVLYNLLM